MENGCGQSIIQVDNELAVLQLAQEAARELTIPWRQSSPHVHQGQGAVEQFRKTLFAQVHATRLDLVDKYNLQSPDNVSEQLLPWLLQHAFFTINRCLVHSDGMTNYQRRWGMQYNSAICNFGEIILADIKHITINKLAIKNNEQKVERIWLGRTTNSDTVAIWTLTLDQQRQQPPDLEHPGEQQQEQSTLEPHTIQPPPGLEQPAAFTYIHPTPKSLARQDNYRPPHRLTGKQPPPIVIQVQPWRQYEDDITMFSEQALQDAMNKELSQLITKQSFKEVDSKTLTQQQLQQVMATRWVITQRPTNNGTKDIKCKSCGKGFSQYINDTDIQTFATTPTIEQEVLVQPPEEYYHNRPHTLWSMTKALYGLKTSPKQWQEHLTTIVQQLGFTRLKSDACLFIYTKSTIYIMACVDDLLVVGDTATTQPFLQQFQQHLELKHTSQLTKTTPLELLGKTIELQDDGTIHLSFAQQYYNKILRAYNMDDKCNPPTTLDDKKPPSAAQPLDNEAVGQLLWVSQTTEGKHCICRI
eukprot:4778125-Amphidinium_carterae.1